MAAKLVLSLAFVACTLAEPYYGYGGYGGGYGGYGYGGHGGYGYGRGVAGHYGGGSSYVGRTIHGLGKRSADAEPEAYYGGYGYGAYPAYAGYARYGGYGRGIAAHPTGTSFTYRSPQGLRGKRSADAEPEAYYGGYGYSAYPAYGYGYGRGVASHYGGGSSYVYRSPQGARGKRSADADAYGYGYPAYGYGLRRGSYQSVSRPYANSHYSVNDRVSSASVYEDNFNGATGYFGRYKREAEPFGYGYGRGSFQTVNRPGSSYAVNDRVSSANVYERNSNYGAAYGYGFNSGYYGRY